MGMVICLIPGFCLAQRTQYWGGYKKPTFMNNWTANVNFGMTSFYGDLSFFDSDIVEKVKLESGPGFSFVGLKHIKRGRFFGGGQLLIGSFKGESSNERFESQIFEYNLQGGVDFLRLVYPYKKNLKFGITGYGGVGQFRFDTKASYKKPGRPPIVVNTGVPEFVFFFGFGGVYHASKKIALTVDLALRQAQNDKLDAFKRNDDYDYYTYMNAGITYKIKSMTDNKSIKYRGRFPMRKKR